MEERRIPLACAAAAVVIGFVASAAYLAQHGWRPSVLVRMAGTDGVAPVARATDDSFVLVDRAAHYDGVYFWAIARDPLARGVEHRLIDRPAYRYGHAGSGWLGFVFAFGRASAVPGALFALALAGFGIAAWAASRLAGEFGRSQWLGLAVAFNPGLIFSVTVLTSEPVGIAAVLVGLLAYVRGRRGWAMLAFVAASFIKEPLMLVPVALATWELLTAVRSHDGSLARRLFARRPWLRIGGLALGPLLFSGWYVYLRNRFGIWPFEQMPEAFSWPPLKGWADSLRQNALFSTQGHFQSQMATVAIPLVVVFFASLLLGALRAVAMRNPVDVVFLLLVPVVFLLGPLAVAYPKDMIREVVLPVTLLPLLAQPAPVPVET